MKNPRIFLTLTMIFGIFCIGGCDMGNDSPEVNSLLPEETPEEDKIPDEWEFTVVNNSGGKIRVLMYEDSDKELENPIFEHEIASNENEEYKLNLVEDNRYYIMGFSYKKICALFY